MSDSPETVSVREIVDRAGYAQEQNEKVIADSNLNKITGQTQDGRTDKDFVNTINTNKKSAGKSHLAFSLSFKIKIVNRTPFDPSLNC